MDIKEELEKENKKFLVNFPLPKHESLVHVAGIYSIELSPLSLMLPLLV